MAALSIQSQPVALLKTRLTQDLLPEKKQDQDFHSPVDKELSYYKQISGFSNYESKWQWDFVYSDGTRTSPMTPSSIKTYKEYMIEPADSKIKLVRVLYAKANSYYPSALVGLELVDHQGKSVLQTKLIKDFYNSPSSDLALKEFELDEHERIIGVKTSRRGSTQYHYDIQFVIGRLE